MRRRVAQDVLGDGFYGTRITRHAASRWVDRVRPKVLRRLVKGQLKGRSSDIFEAMTTALSRARCVGIEEGRDGQFFRDGGLLYVLVPRFDPHDPEMTYLLITVIRPRRRRPKAKAGRDEETQWFRRRQLLAKRAALLERELQAEIRQAG